LVQGHEGIESNETADQLARLGSECPFVEPEPTCDISAGIAEMASEILGVRNRTQTGKGILKMTLCQKNQGPVKTKQKPFSVGDCTAGHDHLKGHLFKMGLTNSPICGRFPEKDESATHILCDCEAITHLRFHHLGHYFLEPGDYQDTPVNKILTSFKV
jgi:hypothetical protein